MNYSELITNYNMPLMHEVLLVLDVKPRDTNILNGINTNKTYIQSFCLYSFMFTNYLAIKVVKMLKRSIMTDIGLGVMSRYRLVTSGKVL